MHVAIKPTKRFPGLKARAPVEEAALEALVGAVSDSRVDHEHQTGLQTSPEATGAVRAINYLPGCGQETLAVALGRRLLASGDDCDGDGEDLGECASSRAKAQLGDDTVVGRLGVLGVKRARHCVPVKVGKVCRRDTNERAVDAGVEAAETLISVDAGDSVPSRGIVRIFTVGRIAFLACLLGLHLQLRLDAAVATS